MLLERAMDLFFEGYFSTCRRSERTIRAYATDLDQFAAFLSPRQTLEKLTPEMLEEWAEELKEAGYASTSIRRKFAALKVFLNYWVRKRVLDRSPAWQIRLDLAPQRVLTRALSGDEMRRLLAAAEAVVASHERPQGSSEIDAGFIAMRDLCIVGLLLATGVRVSELANLLIEDYIPEQRTFVIRGKGAKERLAFLTDRRTCATYTSYLKWRQRLCLDHTSLFVNTIGRSLTSRGIAMVLRGLACAAGLTRRVTPHMIRHTSATFLLRNGVDLRLVQEFLGHSSITTTQRYTHVTKDALIGALRSHHPRRMLTRQS